MSTSLLKKKIHKTIDNIDDESFLSAVYTILKEKIGEYPTEFSNEQKAIIDARLQQFEEGETTLYKWSEAKSIILRKNLKI